LVEATDSTEGAVEAARLAADLQALIQPEAEACVLKQSSQALSS
jgi:hypothetical protein